MLKRIAMARGDYTQMFAARIGSDFIENVQRIADSVARQIKAKSMGPLDIPENLDGAQLAAELGLDVFDVYISNGRLLALGELDLGYFCSFVRVHMSQVKPSHDAPGRSFGGLRR